MISYFYQNLIELVKKFNNYHPTMIILVIGKNIWLNKFKQKNMEAAGISIR